MSEHIRPDELQRFRRGDLTPARVEAVAQHLAACPECAALAGKAAGPNAAESLRLAFAGWPEHPQAEALTEFVDGAGKEEIAQHLRVCAMCRAEVEDLERFGDRLRSAPSTRRSWLPAVAAALVVAVAGVLALRIRTPTTPPPRHSVSVHPASPSLPPPPPPRRADWEALIATAAASGRLGPPPFLREIRPGHEDIRGSSGPATPAELEPSGVVVESDRPRFTWPGGGGRAVVSVFDGTQRVARSPLLEASEWSPTQPLARGRTYQWQVELRSGGSRILPPVPDPPAAFHVMDEASVRQLEAVRKERPGDHLLLAVLYARAGAQREAAAELAAYRLTHPDDDVARRLAASVEAW